MAVSSRSKHQRGFRRWLRPETYDFPVRNPMMRVLKRVVVAVVGFAVVGLGVIMIVTPGPAVVVIPAGFGILAIEFPWARRWVRRFRVWFRVGAKHVRKRHAELRKKPARRE